MINIFRPSRLAHSLQWSPRGFVPRLRLYLLILVTWVVINATCMSDDEARTLRDDAVELFYHGYDNYMKHAFPEDELKPLSCVPLTRDRDNEGHFELNDPLGNYTLTLVDSLSTLAIFASSQATLRNKRKPLQDFQGGVKSFVGLYGDGTPTGRGTRAKGFDLDSKVQVFETVIRGVGGLLSAHLFAIGELPINGYEPRQLLVNGDANAIRWPNGFTYSGQLLKLALEMAQRLLPAFDTPTGLPYPRVNLRKGVPFYPNSAQNQDLENGQCTLGATGQREITETCSAGAGSLVLEFTVLSRLTGDMRFERLAQRAFDSVWSRRSAVGLIGAGIDAESGEWVSPYTGIGAAVDSFFEYAMKSHILYAGIPHGERGNATSLSDFYLSVWQSARENNKRHLMRGAAFQHPHYVQGDVFTGAVRAMWFDSLSAFYPGLLALSGNVEDAIDIHLLFAALWSRYSAIPERWNAASGSIEIGLRWWGGRPEFIESTWYLFRATQDPWFLRFGELVLDDIRKRCWTECGWAGLEDVRTGEQKDRMESFFLGETAKYLFLLFEPSHPFNKLESPWVMNTEGHPLVLPQNVRYGPATTTIATNQPRATEERCQIVPKDGLFGASSVVSRPNFFHASSLARLHLVPALGGPQNSSTESSHWDWKYNRDMRVSRNNHTFYPWTLPIGYVPANGTSMPLETRANFDLSFPTLANTIQGVLAMKRVPEGISLNSVSGLKLGMIKETQPVEDTNGKFIVDPVFRIHTVSHLSLGRDEKVLLGTDAISTLNPVDPYFTRHRDVSTVDVVIDTGNVYTDESYQASRHLLSNYQAENGLISLPNGTVLTNIIAQLNSALQQQLSVDDVVASVQAFNDASTSPRPVYPATVAVGTGAGMIPDVADAPSSGSEPLSFTSIYVTGESCSGKLPAEIAKTHQVIVMRRGGCSFNEKLRAIPSFAPSNTSLQLVIIVSHVDDEGNEGLIRPLLDDIQTTPGGVSRPRPIPMVMIEGDDETFEALSQARSIGLRRHYHFASQGLRINNLFVV